LDNRAGVLDATRRLLARGHRRIAYMCNPASVYSQAERVGGYRQAMAEQGIDDTARWERLEDDRNRTPELVAHDLLTSDDPPTAIVSGNNRMTIGVLRAMRALGDDTTALIGFDDFDTADVIGVSVISYDPFELGRRTAMVALERMADPTGFTRQLTLPTWVVERGTGERPPKETTS
jgi:LacI family transcriptional regulator